MDYQTFDITLNKIQRCIITLKLSLSSEQPVCVSQFSYNSIELLDNDKAANINKLCDKGNLFLSESKTKIDEYLKLYDDILSLESELFNGNTNSGLSTILSQLKYLKEKKTKLQSFVSQIKNYSSYTTCTQDNIHTELTTNAKNIIMKMTSPQWDGTFEQPRLYLLPYNEKDYDKMLTEVTKEISDLENKRDTLNASYTVSVKLSAKSQKLLGL